MISNPKVCICIVYISLAHQILDFLGRSLSRLYGAEDAQRRTLPLVPGERLARGPVGFGWLGDGCYCRSGWFVLGYV